VLCWDSGFVKVSTQTMICLGSLWPLPRSTRLLESDTRYLGAVSEQIRESV
jgi:hypothetical protein